MLVCVLEQRLIENFNQHDAQFGFTKDLTTESAIITLKHADIKTPVFATLQSMSKKAILWKKLQDAAIPQEFINVL